MNVPLLDHLRANYQIADEKNDGAELVVQTYATIEPPTVSKMVSEGWVQSSPTTMVWKFPQIGLSTKGVERKILNDPPPSVDEN